MRRPFRPGAPACRLATMKRSAVRLACRTTGLVLACVLGALPSGAPLLHAAGHPGPPAFSLEARGAPLGEVLKKVSDDTGYRITVDPEWTGWPISGSFKNLPINLGLRRILSNLNHSIVFNEADRRIAIVIKSSPDDGAPAGGTALNAAGSFAGRLPRRARPAGMTGRRFPRKCRRRRQRRAAK